MTDWVNISAWQWETPAWLWLALLPIVLISLSWFWKRRQQTHYADRHLWAWVKVSSSSSFWQSPSFSRVLKTGWQFLAWFLQPRQCLAWAWIALMVALANPRTLVLNDETSLRSGVDILMAVDLSDSMLAQDMKPSRFLFTKALIESLVNRLQPDDRLGLMVFAGKPHLVAPLSFDRALFSHYLNLIEPNMLPTQGSLLKPAVEFGLSHLKVTADRAAILMVFSNGEPEEFAPQAAPENFADLKNFGIATWLLGIGETSAVTIPALSHPSGLLHHQGLLVKTRLEELSLQQLAQDVGGQYFKADGSNGFVNQLLTLTAQLSTQTTVKHQQQTWLSLRHPFIGLALVLLIWAFYGVRWSRRSINTINPSVIGLVALVSIFSVLPNNSVWAANENLALHQEAYDAFKQKSYEAAQQLYEGVGDYAGLFGSGASAYRAKDFESAVLYFREAALMGYTPKQRGQALYNLGNSYYLANLLPNAIEAYEQALIYQPDDANARHNLNLAIQRDRQEKGEAKQQDGEGQGKGSKSRDADGAFYGGQKPSEEAGEGVAGSPNEDSNLDKESRESFLPSEEDRTDFRLKQGAVTLNNKELPSVASAILQQQRELQQIEKFEQKMQTVDDLQVELLKRLFEREEGFQAPQAQPHPMPGVKPW